MKWVDVALLSFSIADPSFSGQCGAWQTDRLNTADFGFSLRMFEIACRASFIDVRRDFTSSLLGLIRFVCARAVLTEKLGRAGST